MTRPNASAYHVVKLTLKHKLDDTNTRTEYLSSREVINDANTTRYRPILIDTSGIGNKQGDYLPQNSTGSITIDISPESYGFERRFLDLLDQYTLINQEVSVYTALVQGTDYDVTSDLTLIWRDLVSSVRANFRRNRLVLRLRGEPFVDRVFAREIDAATFTNAPSQSIGKHIPILLGGSAEMRPIIIDSSDPEEPIWAIGTTLGSAFFIDQSTSHTLYARAHNGKYAAVKTEQNATSAFFADSTAVSTSTALPAKTSGWAVQLSTSAPYPIITNGHLTIDITALDGDERIRFFIAEHDENTGGVGKIIAESPDYDFPSGTYSTGQQVFYFGFDRPAVLDVDSEIYYYFGYRSNLETGFEHKWVDDGGSSDTHYRYYRGVAGEGEGAWILATSQPANNWGLYGVDFDLDNGGNNVDDNGLSHAQMTSEQGATAGIALPNLDQLDLVLRSNGLRDNSGGAITGSANQLLTSAAHIVELFLYEWNGAAWAAGEFDDTLYSSTHTVLESSNERFYRIVSGVLTGRVTRSQVLREVCRNTASHLVFSPDASNKVGLYAWGKEASLDFHITDDDALVESYEIGSPSRVVNHAVAVWAPTSLMDEIAVKELLQEGGTKNYRFVTVMGYNDGGKGGDISAESYDLYGLRELGQNKFNLIGDSTSMENVLESILRQNDMPAEFVTLRVLRHKYSSIKPFQCGTVSVPQLPWFSGTSVKPLSPVYSAAEVTIEKAQRPHRATMYPVQVYNIEFEQPEKVAAELRLTCRLLIHQNDPTGRRIINS